MNPLKKKLFGFNHLSNWKNLSINIFCYTMKHEFIGQQDKLLLLQEKIERQSER